MHLLRDRWPRFDLSSKRVFAWSFSEPKNLDLGVVFKIRNPGFLAQNLGFITEKNSIQLCNQDFVEGGLDLKF